MEGPAVEQSRTAGMGFVELAGGRAVSIIQIHHASCLDWLAEYDGPLFDSCVTDPPYHLTSIVKRFGKGNAAPCKEGATGAYARASRGFMGKEWDGGDIAFRPETWALVMKVLKPGAHIVAFSGTRTYHRMACAIEDAGFEIRDQLFWHYGSGFPKSHDVSKGIDRAAGAERKILGPKVTADGRSRASEAGKGIAAKPLHGGGINGHANDFETAPATPEAEQWQGWGTALKPATEPICLARKPLSEKTVAANVLKWGTGAINIDGCRVDAGADHALNTNRNSVKGHWGGTSGVAVVASPLGRWPANLLHDGSDEVLAGFPSEAGANSVGKAAGNYNYAQYGQVPNDAPFDYADSGSAARFFYSAKAGPLDRIGSAHPTVKPVDLMRWLCRLITPQGGLILEPFAGSGTTGIAAMAEGFDCQMVDIEADHVADIERKLAYLRGEGASRFAEHNHAKDKRAKPEPLGGLFGAVA